MKLVFINNILSNYSSTQYYSSNNIDNRNNIIREIFEHYNIQVDWKDISEIIDISKVIYPICNLNNISNIGRDVFPNNLKEYIRNGLKVCFFHMNECWLGDQFYDFDLYTKKNNIPQENIFLFVNNYKQIDYNKKYNSKIKILNPYFLLQVHSKMLQKNKVKFKEDKKFLFMCHNNKLWAHRISALTLFKHFNLLDLIDYSAVSFNLLNKNSVKNLIGSKFNEVENSYEYIIKNGVTLSHYEKLYDFNEIDSDLINVNTFENSYVNIITETDFEQDVLHITEKSLKPFYYFQYPIFLAPPNHIKKLKELYNFDLFDDIINHSYDNEINNTKRLFMVLEEIKNIKNNKDFFIQNYKKFEERFKNNQKKVIKIIDIEDDYWFIKNNFYGN